MLSQSPPDQPFLGENTTATLRESVLAELEQVVGSASFGRVERPARFLRFLVERVLNEKCDQLKESVIGVEFFGRPASWDPRLDSIVRQEASRLRKRLQRYYAAEGVGAVMRIDVPVGSYVPVFVQRTGVAEPLFAKAPSEIAKPAESRRYRYALVVGLLCVTAGIVAGARWRSAQRSGSKGATSVVVLPFTNLSSDAANQYFADGLTDEITDLLARNKGLRVAARSSASQFKSQAGDVGEVGRKLNVQNIVEGSVERSGDRIKIIAHLERASDGFHLWSNTYERRTSDLFAAQSELAAAIAGNLKSAAGVPSAAKHVPKAEAMDWVMKGRYESQQGTPASLARAEEDFQRAISVDPQYAVAYAALASSKFSEAGARVGLRTDLERKECEQFARNALALDPELAGPHVMLANLAMQYDWNWNYAEKELKLALVATPDATAYTGYAAFLIFRGRSAEADEYLRRAQDLDPFGVATLSSIANDRYLQGRTEERRDAVRRLDLMTSRTLPTQLRMATIDAEEGHLEQAWAEFERLKVRAPAAAAMSEAWSRASLGQREESLRLIRPYEEKYPNVGLAVQGFALVYAHLDDEANTVKWLERSADAREWQALNLAVNPAFQAMENSAGFRALKRRMGM